MPSNLRSPHTALINEPVYTERAREHSISEGGGRRMNHMEAVMDKKVLGVINEIVKGVSEGNLK